MIQLATMGRPKQAGGLDKPGTGRKRQRQTRALREIGKSFQASSDAGGSRFPRGSRRHRPRRLRPPAPSGMVRPAEQLGGANRRSARRTYMFGLQKPHRTANQQPGNGRRSLPPAPATQRRALQLVLIADQQRRFRAYDAAARICQGPHSRKRKGKEKVKRRKKRKSRTKQHQRRWKRSCRVLMGSEISWLPRRKRERKGHDSKRKKSSGNGNCPCLGLK